MTASVTTAAEQPRGGTAPDRTAFAVLFAISFSHLLNDLIQSLIPAIYPILKDTLRLDFSQIGLITLTFQLTASVLQPFIGFYADKRSRPYSLAFGMGMSLLGLLLLSAAQSYAVLLLAAALVGLGSAIFHPESSRVARMASGGRFGLAQSVFQVGGNAGSALGPLLAAFIVVPRGQTSIAWFSLAALLAIIVLVRIGGWYKRRVLVTAGKAALKRETGTTLPRRTILVSIVILMILVFSKNFYTASLTNYLSFYLIDRFGLSVQQAQAYLFVYLGAVALGAVLGGPVMDRVGRKYVIWFSILGALPFTLALPYVGLVWTGVLLVLVGLIMSASLSAIVVYAQELVPGRVGTMSGLFLGLSFGMGGLGAALLGELADRTSIGFVYQVCAYLPAIGLVAALLPSMKPAEPNR